jgi:hypothetical protein
MRLVAIVAALAACGGKSAKSTTPPPPLPETEAKPEEAKPEAKVAKSEEKAPPVPQGPIELTVPVPTTTVKLVSPGKGKRTALRLAPKAGAKQQVELTIDLLSKQTAPQELGGDAETALPTLVLNEEIEVKSVDDKGKAEYVATVNTADVRDSGKFAADKLPKLREIIASLAGLTITGTVDSNGTASDLKLRLEKPQAGSAIALTIIQTAAMRAALPPWPVLPSEPVGVGAKWQVSHPSTQTLDEKVAIAMTETTDYELVSRATQTWTVKGGVKVSGTDQEITSPQGTAKLSKIGGSGNVDATISNGALYPKLKTQVSSEFTVGMSNTSGTVVFSMTQGVEISPK